MKVSPKQMFDVTAQLVNNQEEINCLDKILYGKNSWTRLSLFDDEIVINLQRTKVYVFSDSVLCLGKVLQHPDSNEAWKNRVAESGNTVGNIGLLPFLIRTSGRGPCCQAAQLLDGRTFGHIPVGTQEWRWHIAPQVLSSPSRRTCSGHCFWNGCHCHCR